MTTTDRTAYVIYALDMLHAQAARIPADVKIDAITRANRVRELTGTTDKVKICIPVHDIYAPSVRIGHLEMAC